MASKLRARDLERDPSPPIRVILSGFNLSISAILSLPIPSLALKRTGASLILANGPTARASATESEFTIMTSLLVSCHPYLDMPIAVPYLFLPDKLSISTLFFANVDRQLEDTITPARNKPTHFLLIFTPSFLINEFNFD